jgi:hypothetical protein
LIRLIGSKLEYGAMASEASGPRHRSIDRIRADTGLYLSIIANLTPFYFAQQSKGILLENNLISTSLTLGKAVPYT